MPGAWLLLAVLAADPGPGAVSAGEVKIPEDGQTVTVGRYELQPEPGGGFRSETEVFVARIAPDGSVTFDKKFRIPGPLVWPVMMAAQVLRDATSNKGGPEDLHGLALPIYKPQVPMVTLGNDDVQTDSRHTHKMAFLEATATLRARRRARLQPAASTSHAAGAPANPAGSTGAAPRTAGAPPSPTRFTGAAPRTAGASASPRAPPRTRRAPPRAPQPPPRSNGRWRPGAGRWKWWPATTGARPPSGAEPCSSYGTSATGRPAGTPPAPPSRPRRGGSSPPVSAEAYRSEELRALNQGRPAGRRFDPYRASP